MNSCQFTAEDHQPPQVLPDPHELDVVPKERGLSPEILEAKAESLFFTWLLLQTGQLTSPTESVLRKSSSKVCSHSLQTNSKSGIAHPRRIKTVPSI
jgi:hypothetical protein